MLRAASKNSLFRRRRDSAASLGRLRKATLSKSEHLLKKVGGWFDGPTLTTEREAGGAASRRACSHLALTLPPTFV